MKLLNENLPLTVTKVEEIGERMGGEHWEPSAFINTKVNVSTLLLSQTIF